MSGFKYCFCPYAVGPECSLPINEPCPSGKERDESGRPIGNYDYNFSENVIDSSDRLRAAVGLIDKTTQEHIRKSGFNTEAIEFLVDETPWLIWVSKKQISLRKKNKQLPVYTLSQCPRSVLITLFEGGKNSPFSKLMVQWMKESTFNSSRIEEAACVAESWIKQLDSPP